MMSIMMPVSALSLRFQKQLAEETPLLRAVLRHAERIRGDAEQAGMYTASAALIDNVMLGAKAHLPALRGDLLTFVGTILAVSASSAHIKLAIRILVMLLRPFDPQGPIGSDLMAEVVQYQLDSSILAIISRRGCVGENVHSLASTVATNLF